MKRAMSLLIITGIFSVNAYAADDGFYAGVQAGYGNIGYSKSDLTPSGASVMNALNSTLIWSNNYNNTYDIQQATLSPVSVQSSLASSNNNFAGRLFVGYQFNPYFAIEGGYTKYAAEVGTTSNFSGSGLIGTGGLFQTTQYTNATANIAITNQISENVADIDAKLIYPLADTGFNIYTKVGVAFVDPNITTTVQNVSVNAQGMTSSQILTSSNDIGNNSNLSIGSAVCPTITPGISYDINNHLSADISWTFIKGVNNVQNINFAGAGLTYHFA